MASANPFSGLAGWQISTAVLVVVLIWVISSGQWQPLWNYATQKAVVA